MKASFQTHSDIALIKYWGQKNTKLHLPENGSVSLSLDSLKTATTVEFQAALKRDSVSLGPHTTEKEIRKVEEHLSLFRKIAGQKVFARVVSKNNFPRSTGLSSSASGFAALTLAGARALNLNFSQKELSILARQSPSGSACRCVVGGFVEWREGTSSSTSHSAQLYPASYWDIRDVIVIVDQGQKLVSSAEGHLSAQTSPFYGIRRKKINMKLRETKRALTNKDFTLLGEIAEAEALEFHSILLTSRPALLAWYPGTISVMHEVQELRRSGIEAYFTINTGFNLHVLALPQHQEKVRAALLKNSFVQKAIASKISNGPRELKKHLF